MRTLLLFGTAMFVAGSLLLGCNSKDEKGDSGKSEADPAPSAPGASATTDVASGPLTPAQWTESMVACYQAAVKDTLAALEGTPPADQALPKMRAVYENSIQRHLPLGRQREAMSPADRAKADSSFVMKLMSLQSSDDFKAYIALSNGPYNTARAKTDEEKELAKLVRDVNIISQYGQFDLLKQQTPKEAERLGIE